MRRGLNKNIVRKRALSVKLSATVLLVSFLLALAGAFPAAALTDGVLDYIVQNGEATVTACRAESQTYTLPETVGGYPLTTLGTGFMQNNTQVRELIVPASVKRVQEQCSAIIGLYVKYVSWGRSHLKNRCSIWHRA